jgi:hypothetical protein
MWEPLDCIHGLHIRWLECLGSAFSFCASLLWAGLSLALVFFSFWEERAASFF